MDVSSRLKIFLSSPTGQTLIQIPQGDLYSFLSFLLLCAQLILSTGGGKFPFSLIALTGHSLTHSRHLVHKSSVFMGLPSTSACVNIEVNLTLCPYFEVNRTLFCPKEPKPARYAACLCEKNANGFSRSTSMSP